MMFVLQIIMYAFALWLGLYLLRREPRAPRLVLAGLGLVAYALALGVDILGAYAGPAAALTLLRLRLALLVLPAACWVGAIVLLLPGDDPLRPRLVRSWQVGFLPLVALLALLALVAERGDPAQANISYAVLVGVLGLGLLAALVALVRSRRPDGARQTRGLIVVVSLFFGLGLALPLRPFSWFPQVWALPAIGFDLILLGVAVALMDAFEQGEALLPDLLRSMDYALGLAALFGVQVGLVMLATGATLPLVALLLAVVGSAIAMQVFAEVAQRALDGVVFARLPRVRQARAELRAAADALPRGDLAVDLSQIDEAEFMRLTRRALSYFGDLPRLATSPLIYLPVIDERLAERGVGDDALERAVELKALLAESVQRLKPRNGSQFGTSDEWRHYNALYFPYVAGLKPYSSRAQHQPPDAEARSALAWLRDQVPERTLYNWQNAAARLVAQDLRQTL